MIKDLLVVSVISTIVEVPDTTPMSVRLTTKEEKNHLQGREGVEMIVMNEEPLAEARIQKGRTSHQELYKTKTSSSCW